MRLSWLVPGTSYRSEREEKRDIHRLQIIGPTEFPAHLARQYWWGRWGLVVSQIVCRAWFTNDATLRFHLPTMVRRGERRWIGRNALRLTHSRSFSFTPRSNESYPWPVLWKRLLSLTCYPNRSSTMSPMVISGSRSFSGPSPTCSHGHNAALAASFSSLSPCVWASSTTMSRSRRKQRRTPRTSEYPSVRSSSVCNRSIPSKRSVCSRRWSSFRLWSASSLKHCHCFPVWLSFSYFADYGLGDRRTRHYVKSLPSERQAST